MGVKALDVPEIVGTHQYVNGANHLGLVGKILDVAGSSWFMLEVITMLTNSQRRALHDWFAGTVVVFGD